jgi:copper chaperone CopZ
LPFRTAERKSFMKKRFNCEIDCANCAAKVEEAIKKLDGVSDARVNFMTQKFTLDAEDDRFDEILQEALKTGQKIEPDFSIER